MRDASNEHWRKMQQVIAELVYIETTIITRTYFTTPRDVPDCLAAIRDTSERYAVMLKWRQRGEPTVDTSDPALAVITVRWDVPA